MSSYSSVCVLFLLQTVVVSGAGKTFYDAIPAEMPQIIFLIVISQVCNSPGDEKSAGRMANFGREIQIWLARLAPGIRAFSKAGGHVHIY